MSDAAEFLRILAMAVLREGEPAILAPRAAEALRDVWVERKSLVLDVQFTGFTSKGQPVGPVDPVLLRAAGQLIMLRVTRVGFTPDAGEDDLAPLFEALARTAAELGPEGILPLIRQAQPRGVYLSTSTGVYRPPAAAPPSTETASGDGKAGEGGDASTPAASASGDGERATVEAAAPPAEAGSGGPAPADDGDDDLELAGFELIEDVPELDAQAPAGSASGAAAERAEAKGEVAGNDMFHFFRAVTSERQDAEADHLPELLRAAENVTRFDELAQGAARAAQRLVRADDHQRAVALLDALVRESQRPDRSRLFREAAVQALRRAGADETLHRLADLLPNAGPDRERILDLFVFLGGDAVAQLENHLFRTGDAELRQEIFGRLRGVEGSAQRIIARAMGDASIARTRLILELAVLPGVDPEMALRWITEGAAHPDAAVRMDAARHASTLGGRGGLRVLLDQLGDGDRLVKRAAIQGLGTLGDAAAVPFLARLLGEGSDEEVQLAAISALGRIGSPEALPSLMGVANRRSLFGGKKLGRARSAAVQAIGRIGTQGAREVLHSIAAGKDADLAEEARRALSILD